MTHTLDTGVPPPDQLNAKIGVLTRREVEARLLAPLIEALGAEFGRERVIAVVRDAIVDHEPGVADHCAQRAGDAQRLPLPEHRSVRVDDAPCAHQRSGFQAGRERAGEAEGDEPALGQRQSGLQSHARGARVAAAGGVLLDG